jgi:hypothetical protein
MTNNVFSMADRPVVVRGSTTGMAAKLETGLVGIILGAGLGLAVALVLVFLGARNLISSAPLLGLIAGGAGGLAGCCVGLVGRIAARFNRFRTARVHSSHPARAA